MKRSELRDLIRECLQEVLEEGRRICAWCKKDMGEFNGATGGDTHGICSDCLEKQMADINKANLDKEPPDPRSHLRQPDPDRSHYMGDTDRT